MYWAVIKRGTTYVDIIGERVIKVNNPLEEENYP